MATETIRYLTAEVLRAIPDSQWNQLGNARSADRLKRQVDPIKRYPILRHFLAASGGVRCTVTLDEQGSSYFIDLPLVVFEHLPTMEVALE